MLRSVSPDCYAKQLCESTVEDLRPMPPRVLSTKKSIEKEIEMNETNKTYHIYLYTYIYIYTYTCKSVYIYTYSIHLWNHRCIFFHVYISNTHVKQLGHKSSHSSTSFVNTLKLWFNLAIRAVPPKEPHHLATGVMDSCRVCESRDEANIYQVTLRLGSFCSLSLLMAQHERL